MGLPVGSTSVRVLRPQVSGLSGTCRTSHHQRGEVVGSVQIAIDLQPARRTAKHPDVRRQLDFHHDALRAGLRRREPTAGHDQTTTPPPRPVLQLPPELGEPDSMCFGFGTNPAASVMPKSSRDSTMRCDAQVHADRRIRLGGWRARFDSARQCAGGLVCPDPAEPGKGDVAATRFNPDGTGGEPAGAACPPLGLEPWKSHAPTRTRAVGGLSPVLSNANRAAPRRADRARVCAGVGSSANR